MLVCFEEERDLEMTIVYLLFERDNQLKYDVKRDA